MKIRLFKLKTPSNTEISIAVEAFNSPANLCLKGNNLHNRRYATCGQRYKKHMLPKRQNDCRVVQMNIHTGKKEQTKRKFVI